MAWYVVFRGRKPGIYNDWPTCNAQVSGYSRSNYMKYSNKDDAIDAYNNFFGLNEKQPTLDHALGGARQATSDSRFIWKDVVIAVLIVSNLFLVCIVLALLGKEC